MEYNELAEKLKSNNQYHLLKYYSTLNDKEKELLLHQINQVDFEFISNAVLKKTEDIQRGNIEPIEVLEIQDIEKNIDEYDRIGTSALNEGKVAIVLLAGGQGTRLGSDKPKGMLNVGVTKNLYIFEVLINETLRIVKKAGAWIPFYVMTSEKNHEDTVGFFKENNYFGYDKGYIHFFKQDMLPSVDKMGKILMEDKYKLSLSPNGNGGWFSSLVRSDLYNDFKKSNIEWINIFSVDNVLQKIADPIFIGATIGSGKECGAKVVSKASPDERVGVMCLEDGKPSIVEYYELSEEMSLAKDNKGKYLYNYGVILNYLFKVKKLEQIVELDLPVHVVEKKVPYINEDGEFITPEIINAYKFETLILDMIHMMDSCLPYEVNRNKEFAPIKNRTGVDSLESARVMMKNNNIDI